MMVSETRTQHDPPQFLRLHARHFAKGLKQNGEAQFNSALAGRPESRGGAIENSGVPA
jgi:hypothetical protein